MKCLCCEQTFDDQLSLKYHYVNFHNFNENKPFFQKTYYYGQRFYTEKVFSLWFSLYRPKGWKKPQFFISVPVRW